MRRRDFIAGFGSAAAWPVVARAQHGERLRRVGVLTSGTETDLLGTETPIKRALSRLTAAEVPRATAGTGIRKIAPEGRKARL